jgi:hypothetical protein
MVAALISFQIKQNRIIDDQRDALEHLKMEVLEYGGVTDSIKLQLDTLLKIHP